MNFRMFLLVNCLIGFLTPVLSGQSSTERWKNPIVKRGYLDSPLVEVTPLSFKGGEQRGHSSNEDTATAATGTAATTAATGTQPQQRSNGDTAVCGRASNGERAGAAATGTQQRATGASNGGHSSLWRATVVASNGGNGATGETEQRGHSSLFCLPWAVKVGRRRGRRSRSTGMVTVGTKVQRRMALAASGAAQTLPHPEENGFASS